MMAQHVVEICMQLEAAGIAIWLDGGWGVDALLGEQTRPHDDLDLIVRLDDVPRMRTLLGREGFHLVEGEAQSNFVLKDQTGRKIDVHTVRFDEQGNGIYRMLNGAEWVYLAAGFAGRGRVEGRQVRCLTAEVQMLCHAGYELDEDDRRDLTALHDRFGVDISQAHGNRN